MKTKTDGGNMIDNSDTVGHWDVTLIANVDRVAGFQCPTPEDAEAEARSIAARRAHSGLPTARAYRRQIIGRTDRGLELGPKIEIIV